MVIHSITRLQDFDFWGGAVANASLLTGDELNQIESELNEIYPEGINDVTLNDLFWFDFAEMCRLIGLDEDEVRERDVDC